MGARKGAPAQRRPSRRWRAKPLDATVIGPVIRELMPIGDDEPPMVTGHFDAAGDCRRIVASYPSGWQVTVRLNAKLEVTSTSAKISLRASMPAREQVE